MIFLYQRKNSLITDYQSLQIHAFLTKFKKFYQIVEMKVLNKLKQLIKKMDLFAEAGLLRYRQQSQYNTFLGGFCSLAVILIVLIIFYGKIKNTFNRVEISYWVQDKSTNIPAPYGLSYENDFMFGVQIHGHNISDTTKPRYFDLIFEYYQAENGSYNDANSKFYHLQPCTENHWNKHPKVLNEAKIHDFSQMACMPLSQNFEIKGKLAAEIFNYIILTVSKCSNSSFYSQPCASQEQIDAFFVKQGHVLYYGLFFISATINPNDQQVIKYHLQDKHYIPFSKTYGANSFIMLQQFEIRTDDSITPINDISKIKGIKLSSENSRKDFFLRDSNVNLKRYSSFRFYKSSQAKIYHRSFVKLDQTLAYLGGLIQTIILFLMIVRIYSSYAFQMDIAAHLFNSQRKGTNKPLREYNFPKFMLHLLYKGLNLIGIQPNWKGSKQYFETKKEILQQLDVRFLFKRITFLEKTLQILMTDHERKALILQRRQTITDAKKNRKNYKERIKYLKLWQRLLQNGQFANHFIDNRIQSQRQFVQNTNTLKVIDDNLTYKCKLYKSQNENSLANTKAKIKEKIQEQYLSQDDSDFEEKGQKNVQNQKQQFCRTLLRIQNEILGRQETMGNNSRDRGYIWYNIDPQIKKMFYLIEKRKNIQEIESHKQESDNEFAVNGLEIKLNSFHGSIQNNSQSQEHKQNPHQLQPYQNKAHHI